MERQNISPAVYHMLQNSQPHICCCRKKLFHVERTVGQGQKFLGRECATLNDFISNAST